MNSHLPRSAVRPTASTVATGFGFTTLFFTLTVSSIAALVFAGFGPIAIVAFVAAFLISSIGATLAAPVGILFALGSERLLRSNPSPSAHTWGQFLAGAITGALAGLATAAVVDPADTFAEAGWFMAVAATITGSSAAGGWHLATSHERSAARMARDAATAEQHDAAS